MKNKENTRRLEQVQTRKQESGSKVKEKEEIKRMRGNLSLKSTFFLITILFFSYKKSSVYSLFCWDILSRPFFSSGPLSTPE
jgi:hypothetical protein